MHPSALQALTKLLSPAAMGDVYSLLGVPWLCASKDGQDGQIGSASPEGEVLCRQGFTYVLEAVDQLVAVLKERGSERAVDMDDAAQRVSMEVCHHTDIHSAMPTAGTH